MHRIYSTATVAGGDGDRFGQYKPHCTLVNTWR